MAIVVEKRVLTEETRAAIAASQRKQWAKRKAEEAEAERLKEEERKAREAAACGALPDGFEVEPDLYKAMCHVMGLPKEWDKTPLQERTRKWSEENIGTFMARYGELQRARQVPEVVEATEEADEGTEKALRHLERFLEGGDVIDGDMAQESAQGEDGERPV